jgi:hypothetical protein
METRNDNMQKIKNYTVLCDAVNLKIEFKIKLVNFVNFNFLSTNLGKTAAFDCLVDGYRSVSARSFLA